MAENVSVSFDLLDLNPIRENVNMNPTQENVNKRKFRYCGKCNRPTYRHPKPWGENCNLNVLNLEELEQFEQTLTNDQNYDDNARATNVQVEPLSCEKCLADFSDTDALRDHIQTHHSRIEYCCDKCELKFVNNDDLTEHLRTMHKSKKFYCDKCEYVKYDTEEKLKNHKLNFHKDENNQQQQLFQNQQSKRMFLEDDILVFLSHSNNLGE